MHIPCHAAPEGFSLLADCSVLCVDPASTNNLCLPSGSGRQLRPAEPPGDADADADAEDEDSVSFLELNFSVMTVWQNGILNILLVIFLPIKNVVF